MILIHFIFIEIYFNSFIKILIFRNNIKNNNYNLFVIKLLFKIYQKIYNSIKR